jgi:hypothetical protein
MGNSSSNQNKTIRRGATTGDEAKSPIVPLFGNAKHLVTLQDYPKATLPQIIEAYEYWVHSEYRKGATLSIFGFEDVFGQLFADPIEHYNQLQNPFVSAVPTSEVFYLFALFCDGDMKNKLKFICDMNRESRAAIRLDTLQFMVHRIFVSLQLAFSIEIPLKDELNSFIELSVKEYIERTVVAHEHTVLVTNAASNTEDLPIKPTPEKSLSFADLWLWSQDVSMISSFLDAIQSICSTVTSKFDLSHNCALRSSFFSQTTRRSQTSNSNLGSILQKWQTSNLTQYIWLDRHPTWNFTFKDMSQSSWLEEMAILESDQHALTIFEHILLSPRKCAPIVQRVNPNSSQQTCNPATRASTTALIPHHHRPFSLYKAPHATNYVPETVLHSSAARSPRSGRSMIRAQTGDKLELLGIMDCASAITWILHCTPPAIFADLIHEQESSRAKRPSFEFSLRKSPRTAGRRTSLISAILANELNLNISSHKQTMENTIDDANTPNEQVVSDGGEGDLQHELPQIAEAEMEEEISSSITALDAFTVMVKDKAISWQSVGEQIVHTAPEVMYELESFVVYNKRYFQSKVYTTDYPLYNAFHLFAQGYRHIPLCYDLQHSYYNLHHVIDLMEMADYLRNHFHNFFPNITDTTKVFCSGLMRRPMTVASNDNLGSVWLKMIQSQVDSALVLDENKKVCGVITLQQTLRELWWRWKQKQLSTEGVNTLGNLELQYTDGKYRFYDPPREGSSNTNSLPTPVQRNNSSKVNMLGLNISININIGTSAVQDNEAQSFLTNLSFFDALANKLDNSEKTVGLKLYPLDLYLMDDEKKKKMSNGGKKKTTSVSPHTVNTTEGVYSDVDPRQAFRSPAASPSGTAIFDDSSPQVATKRYFKYLACFS